MRIILIFNAYTELNNEELNSSFTEAEVSRIIKKLKNNKACGTDMILNEFLKTTGSIMTPLYTKLFNLILHTGFPPYKWVIGIIKPLFKGKGDISSPDNYRGITILSCFCKLFTSVLNCRLYNFLNNNGLLGEEQAGFRPEYSVMDHIFTLNALLDLYLFKKKKLFCAFIDFKKAFDSVHRTHLWKKLLSHNINGNVLRIIFNLYEEAKSCISLDNEVSDCFPCNVGVRQGENLSPLLFAVFLNDLESHLCKKFNGLEFLRDQVYEHLEDDDVVIILRLFVLLYADDTIILAESAEELQMALDAMQQYCNNWSLTVNVEKTKIVIFSRGKLRIVPHFVFGNDQVEVVGDFRYLGITFNFNNKFNKCKSYLHDQASRAMFSLIQKAKKFQLPVDIMLELFDKLVMPILTYGAEVWGFSDLVVLERLHLKFLKMILHVKSTTTNCMVYGEFGAFPIHVVIYSKMLGFWSKVCNSRNDSKISVIMFRLLKLLDAKGIYSSPWITKVKDVLNSLGMSNLWLSSNVNVNWFKAAVSLRLKDQYCQKWSEDVNSSAICTGYRLFKHNFELEKYLLNLSLNDRILLAKFRTSNIRIPVNTLRYGFVPREERKCELCEDHDIGDEFHYLLQCKYFSQERKQYLKKYYFTGPNVLKFAEVLSSKNIGTLRNLAKFIRIISHVF